MNSISPLGQAKKISKLFIGTTTFRAGVLVILCMLLPGCADNLDYGGNTGIILPTISANGSVAQLLLFLQNPLEIISSTNMFVATNAEQTTPANNVIPTDDQKTNSLQHFPLSSPALTDEDSLSVHDNGDEENGLQITFSRLLRVLIIAVFIVMII